MGCTPSTTPPTVGALCNTPRSRSQWHWSLLKASRRRLVRNSKPTVYDIVSYRRYSTPHHVRTLVRTMTQSAERFAGAKRQVVAGSQRPCSCRKGEIIELRELKAKKDLSQSEYAMAVRILEAEEKDCGKCNEGTMGHGHQSNELAAPR